MNEIAFGTHLPNLNNFLEQDKQKVVVTRTFVKGQQVPISFYEDNAWDISPHLSVRTKARSVLNFDIKLKDGSSLIDPKNKQLLESFKRFIFVRWKEKSPNSAERVTAQTLKNSFGQLQPFILWMNDQKLSSFNAVTAEHINQYVNYVIQRDWKPRTKLINLHILSIYYYLGEFLEDKLSENPFLDMPVTLLLEKKFQAGSVYTNGPTTEVIPIRLLKKLVSACVELLNTSEPFLECFEEITKIKSELLPVLIKTHRKNYPTGFKSSYCNEKNYISIKLSHNAAYRTRPFFHARGINDVNELNKRIVLLRIAAWVVCGAFSGMRESELASLVEGCFVREYGFDDEEFCWIKGKTYKLETEPKSVRWMVPSVVEKAIQVAERISAPVRKEAEERITELENSLETQNLNPEQLKSLSSELNLLRLHRSSIFMGDRLRCWTSSSCSLFLKQIAEYADIRIEEEDLPHLSQNMRQNLGQIWPLKNHQFRRTFAVMVARNLMGDVRYLREHFKHWSLDMTLYYARHEQDYLDGNIMSEIIAERDELQDALLEKWIFTRERLSGGAGERIVQFRGRNEVKTARDMRQFARKLGDDVCIRGTGHSWCMSNGQGCGGHGLYDAIRCASCGEGVIDSSHVLIWKGIKQQQLEVLACEDLGEPARQRCLNHLKEAEHVLRELEIEK